MRALFLWGMALLVCSAGRATEVIWMPMGTPQVTPVEIPTPSSRQTPVTGPGENKNGYYLYTYTDGTTESEGNYVSGKKEGVWKYYRPDGSEIREMEFANGVPTGMVVLTAPTGE